MKAHWQTYVMCLFCRHLGGKKDIAYCLYYGPQAGPCQKICCSLAERAGPGSFMLALGGPGCKSAGPCHLYPRSRIKNYGTGAEPEFESVIPATSTAWLATQLGLQLVYRVCCVCYKLDNNR